MLNWWGIVCTAAVPMIILTAMVIGALQERKANKEHAKLSWIK